MSPSLSSEDRRAPAPPPAPFGRDAARKVPNAPPIEPTEPKLTDIRPVALDAQGALA